MTTAAINTGAKGNQLPQTATKDSKFALKTEDFINMMVTQLQNQDPLEPTKNQELLAQMSQIGQLQSSTSLTASLKTMVMQNSLGSAGNLIGKTIKGMNDQNESVTGLVNSVRVENDKVFLELDNGKSLAMERVTSIAPSAATSSTTPATTPAVTAPTATTPAK